MLRSDLCDYSDSYILFIGAVTVQTENNRAIDGYNRNLILKNNAPFSKCISKINNVLIDNAEDLGIVIPMYRLIEYSKNYSKASSTSWNYKRYILDVPIRTSESFKYKVLQEKQLMIEIQKRFNFLFY